MTAAMVAIVLSVFMAGLALGNAVGGRVVERPAGEHADGARLYAACELTIAAVRLASCRVGPRAGRDPARAERPGRSGRRITSPRRSGSRLALLPFCIAMGATLPLALAAIGPRVRGGRSSVGHLYAANVLGAALGTLASAFVLDRAVRLPAARSPSARRSTRSSPPPSLLLSLRAPPAAAVRRRRRRRPAAATPARSGALFVTGFASMAMEVVWVRQFTPLLGNVVYAFASILASYLAGHARRLARVSRAQRARCRRRGRRWRRGSRSRWRRCCPRWRPIRACPA